MSSLSVRNFEARPVSVCSGEGKRKAREEEKDDKRPNSCYPSSIGKKTKTKESWGSEPTSANTDDTLVSIFSSRTTEIGSSASAALSSERVTPVSLGFSSSMGDASSPVPFRVKTPQGAVRPNIAFSPSLLSQFKSLSQGSKGCFNSPDLAPSVQPNQSASNLSPLFPPGNLTFKGFTSLSNLRTPSNDCNSDEELKSPAAIVEDGFESDAESISSNASEPSIRSSVNSERMFSEHSESTFDLSIEEMVKRLQEDIFR